MSENKKQKHDLKELCSKADAKLKRKIVKLREQSAGDPERVLHELQVHQIELEMQNEELRRAQQQLEESRSKYSDLYDFAPMGYFTLDKTGNVVEANLTGCRMLGVERSNLIKKPFHLFVDKDSQDAFYKHRKAALTAGLKQTCEITLVRKNRDKFEAQLESVPAEDAKGKVAQIRTVVTDITERKENEYKLREQAQILDRVHDAVVATDLDAIITGWNDGARKMFGYSAKEAIGKHISLLQPPDQRKFIQKKVTGPLKKKGFLEIELKQRKKSGEDFYVHLSLSMLADEKGRPAGMIGFALDITERKQIEQLMHKVRQEIISERNRLWAVLETLPVGVSILDAKGGNIQANRMFEQIWGGSRPHAQSVKDYAKYKARWADTGKPVKPKEWASAQAVQKGKTVLGQLFEIERFDGSRAHVLNSAAPILDADGKIVGSVVAILDITKQKKVEEALRQSEENVRKQAAQLTATLNAAPAMIWTATDRDCRIITGNRAAYEFSRVKEGNNLSKSGSTPERLEHYRIFRNGRELSAKDMPIQQVAASGREIKDYSIDFVFDDGTIHSVLGNVNPILDSEGKPAGAVGVFIDITERKRAEEVIKEHAAFLQNLIDTIPAPIFYKDYKGIYTGCNVAFENYLGLKKEQIIGRDVYGISPKHLADMYCEKDKDVFEKRINQVYESRVRYADGTEHDVIFYKKPFINQDGNLYGLVGTILDITERKQAEEALRESQKDLNRAQTVGNIGSWRLNVQKNILSWSDENHRIFGIPKGMPLTYETFLSTVHPDDREYVDAKWKAGLAGENYDIEHRIIVKGQIKWVHEKAYLEFDNDGVPLGGFGITQDITELKKAEEQINNLARFPEENPFPVLRLSNNGIITYSNKPGLILVEHWERKVGQKAPKKWCGLIERASQSDRYLVEEVKCGDKIFSIAIAPVPEGRYVNLYGRDITKQIQVEKALEEANKFLEERVEERTAELNRTIEELKKTKSFLLQAHRIASLGTWEWDVRENKLAWSDEIYQIFGIDNEKSDLTYEWFLSFIHPDDVDFVNQSIDKALNNKEIYSIEHRIIRQDGNERIVRQRAEVIYNAADEPIRMVGTAQDITEDKRKEKRLQQQDLDIKSKAELLDLAHDTIIVHDLDGKINYWNKGAENTYGWKREEILGKVTHEILQTKFSEPLLKIISSVSSKGNWEGELIHTAKNGKQIIVESRWALQKDEQGRPSAILEIERDITEKKSAEKKSKEARIYAESIIETIQEALVALDSELKVLSANKTFYKLFGLKPEETEGKFIYKLGQNQWDIPELRMLLEDILPKNTSFEEYEMEYGPSKGPDKVLLLNARRIYQDRKKTEMILLAIQDITSRKQQERRIVELTEELLLAEEEQRQKVATALHDSIGQMLAFSKRELASLLKEPNLRTNVRLKKVLNEIIRSIKQSRELTADLSSPTLHTFGLEAALEELAEQFSKDNDLNFSFNTTEEPKPLEKKVELLLYRSVKELLCNIAKHSRAKNVIMDVNTADNFLELMIADDGKGFDTSYLNANKTRKKSFGLFSIQQRLTNVKGSFNIESEKKKGTKVILRAPLNIAELKKGK